MIRPDRAGAGGERCDKATDFLTGAFLTVGEGFLFFLEIGILIRPT
jgi:hypothetical protein